MWKNTKTRMHCLACWWRKHESTPAISCSSFATANANSLEWLVASLLLISCMTPDVTHTMCSTSCVCEMVHDTWLLYHRGLAHPMMGQRMAFTASPCLVVMNPFITTVPNPPL